MTRSRCGSGLDCADPRAPRPPATWPDGPVPQQAHLDCEVSTGRRSPRPTGLALDPGATLLRDRAPITRERLYVLGDPAGHPFCIFADL